MMDIIKVKEELGYVLEESSCLRRKVGAMITNGHMIIAASNGAPNPLVCDTCIRHDKKIPSGTRGEGCKAIHAEQRAIMRGLSIAMNFSSSIMYVTHKPCSICARMIIGVGIPKVVYLENYPDEFSEELFEEAGVKLIHLKA